MQFRPFVLACAGLSLLVASHASAENLIQNGNFQTSSVTPGTYQYANGFGPYGGPLEVQGWDFRDGTGVANHSQAWGGQASTGVVAFLQNYPLPNFEHPTVSQSFTSSAGSFAISFDLSSRPGYDTSSIDVYLDSQRVAQNLVAPNANWTHFSFNAAGLSGSSHTLGFYAFSGTTNDSVTYLSNVAVTAVPEPETWALMLLGLAGLGWRARRKSN